MRRRLLQWVVCPACTGDLRLRVEESAGDRIRTGRLDCAACGATYPIREYVPRFVGDDDYVESFSFEWHRFREVQIDSVNGDRESERTLAWKTGWSPDDLRGRLVLDAGVGAGRFAEVASRWGAEVVGVDLSFAVDAARETLDSRPNVHLVQADLFRPPFRPGTFERAYSIGVLHHTPDTRAAFGSVASLVAPGGQLAVFLYARGHYHYFSDLWRRVTTRLPSRLLHALCWVAVPLYWIHRVPFFGRAAQFLLPTANWPSARWRWLDTFDWYSPTYQWKHTWPEVWSWFRDEGFAEMELFELDPESSLAQICMKGTLR